MCEVFGDLLQTIHLQQNYAAVDSENDSNGPRSVLWNFEHNNLSSRSCYLYNCPELQMCGVFCNECVLSIILDSNVMREISVNTSEDSIIGLALIEAYPQEVNLVKTNDSSSDCDIFVSSLQEDAGFPVVAVQTISNVSEHDEGIDAASFDEEQRSFPSLRTFWQFAEHDKKDFSVDNGLLYRCLTLWVQKLKQLCLPD